MAFLQNQTTATGDITMIGKHNKEAILSGQNEGVLYALGHKKPKNKMAKINEDEDEEDEEMSVSSFQQKIGKRG